MVLIDMSTLHNIIQENHPLIHRKIQKLQEMITKQENGPVRLSEPMARLFLEEIEEMEQEIYNAAFPQQKDK